MRRPVRRDRNAAEPETTARHTNAVWQEPYSLGEECEAYLRGEYLEWCRNAGLPLRPWMYLNRVAHAPWESIVRPGPQWDHAAMPRTWADVALMVEELVLVEIRPTELVEVQTDLLAPLELAVCSRPCSPRQVYALAVHGIL